MYIEVRMVKNYIICYSGYYIQIKMIVQGMFVVSVAGIYMVNFEREELKILRFKIKIKCINK